MFLSRSKVGEKETEKHQIVTSNQLLNYIWRADGSEKTKQNKTKQTNKKKKKQQTNKCI